MTEGVKKAAEKASENGIDKFHDIGIHIPGLDKTFHVSGAIVEMWIIMAILILFTIFLRVYMKKVGFKKVPETKFQNIMEALVKWIYNLVESTMGKDYLHYAPFIGSIGIMLLFCDLFSLTGIPQPTANVAVPIGFAIVVFFNIHFQAIKKNGFKGWINIFISPYWWMFPINAVAELAVPVTMSMRLFGNMISGAVIMGLVYKATSGFLYGIPGFLLPIPLHAFFDVFDGCIQTFVFMMLTMIFIKNAQQHGEHH